MCEDRGRHKSDVDCRSTEIHERSTTYKPYYIRMTTKGKRQVLLQCNAFYFFPCARSTRQGGRPSTAHQSFVFLHSLHPWTGWAEKVTFSFVPAWTHNLHRSSSSEKNRVKHRARTQHWLTKEKLRADKNQVSHELVSGGCVREETVSLNNGPPATYRICIKHTHDSGGEVVQHHWSGTSSKHMTKKERTGINSPNATRRISPAGTTQQTGLGKTSGAPATDVKLLSGLWHSSFSGNCKNVLPRLLSIFQDAAVPPGFF